MAITKAKAPTAIVIPPLNLQVVRITLVGDSSLICHRWSEKARAMMLAKQMKQARSAKSAKDPEEEYRDSLYAHPEGGFGFPVVAFKNAAVSACAQVEGLTKVLARTAFHIDGELAKIEGEPSPREDMVKISMGVADIRFRGEFKQWRTTLTIRYNADVVSASQLVHLFNIAGFGVGVGEWRPERDGSFGRFHVASEQEVS